MHEFDQVDEISGDTFGFPLTEGLDSSQIMCNR